MDKKAIEIISVSAVRNSIVTSPFLDQFIPDNDKEPSWDGNVYIYKDASKKKEKLEGRMPVQVKGKECNDFSKEEISYPMQVADLRNYLHDGGAILFAVYISDNGEQTKIYYAELTPIKLRILLRDAGQQTSKVVKLREFPSDGNKKSTIFLNCLQNCQKQASFIESDLPSLEEIEKTGCLESIIIPWAGVGVKDPLTALFTSEVYMYANLKGAAAPQPIDVVPFGLTAKTEKDALVKAGGNIFYEKYDIIRDAKTTKFQFGKSLTLSFPSGGGQCNVIYKNSPSLRTLTVDLDFMLSFIEAGYFEVDNTRFPFFSTDYENSNFNIEKEKARLEFAKRSVCVLDTLNCKADLDLSILSDQDVENLLKLGIALIDHAPVQGLREDLPPIASINVGNLKFALVFVQHKENPGEYLIEDFFSANLSLGYTGHKGTELRTSKYAILHAEDLINVANLRPELFLPSFQEVENEETFIRANLFLLELLKAYDLSGEARNDLFSAAKEFAMWLKEAPAGDQCPDPIRLLNYYQVIKRERRLNDDEQQELWNLVDAPETAIACKVGAYSLLDQKIPALKCFEKLNEEEKEEFKTFPIFRFLKSQD